MFYVLSLDDIASLAGSDVYTTIGSIIVPDTAGVRARIRMLSIGPSDDAPGDLNLSLKIARIADVSVGGAGTLTAVSAGNMGKLDPDQTDAPFSGGVAYTAEPTTYESSEPLWMGSMNDRGGIQMYWDANDAPRATRDMLIGLLAAPRTAQAIKITGSMLVESY